MRRLFLGIDVSTTGAKALLIDEKGEVAASATTPLTLQTPKPLWSEQDPHEWWKGTSASIRKALADAGAKGADVAAVGLTGQMHGLVLLDGQKNVLRPAILWNDQRTGAECDEIHRRVGRAEAHPRGRQRRPHRLHRAQDPLGAQPRAGGLREGEARPPAQGLRPPAPHRRRRDGQGRRLGHAALRSEGARLVAAGARAARDPGRVAAAHVRGPGGHGTGDGRGRRGDGPRGGHARHGRAAATSRRGRSARGRCAPASSRSPSARPASSSPPPTRPSSSPRGASTPSATPSPASWHFMGVTLSAAGSLQWYHDTLVPGESFSAIVAEAEQAPAGSEGLLFRPTSPASARPTPTRSRAAASSASPCATGAPISPARSSRASPSR